MSLHLSSLENARRRGESYEARCPACAEEGRDTTGNHLWLKSDGRFGCAARPGDVQHRKRIFALVGDKKHNATQPVVPRPRQRETDRSLWLPPLRIPSVSELVTIERTRGLPVFAGLELAVRAGVLRVAEMKDAGEIVTAWILTDSARIAAQARRLDGKLWRGIEAKAKTLPGSSASWPVGAADIGDRGVVMLCEGTPDCLAALTVAWLLNAVENVAPVAMLGAGQTIHGEAIPFFRAKHVRIIEQNDDAARRAGRKWYDQLRSTATAIDGWEPPAADKDISDTFTRLSREHHDVDELARALRRTGIMDGLNQGGHADDR